MLHIFSCAHVHVCMCLYITRLFIRNEIILTILLTTAFFEVMLCIFYGVADHTTLSTTTKM